MKIKMLTLSAGPGGVLTPGSITEMPTAQAQNMIAGGYAVEVEVKKAAPVKPEAEIETAEAVPAPERAMVSAGKGKSTSNKGKSTSKK